MQNIYNYTLKELESKITSLGLQKYKAKQIFSWLYQKFANDFEKMTSLSKQERAILLEHFSITDYTYSKHSGRNAIKYLITFEDGESIESVVIMGSKRKTLCVSTQVGCPFNCRFCATGKMGFKRNLSSGEIIIQFIVAHIEGHEIDNIVFMGMGEPLLNLDNVLMAIDILNDKNGANFGMRRFTISTAGVIPGIMKLMKQDRPLNLAVSFNAPNDKIRDTLMPLNKKYPIKLLLEAAYEYAQSSGRRVTLEYILLKDINDSTKQAEELADLIHGLGFHLNIIPYNNISKEFSRSSHQDQFVAVLEHKHVNVTVRQSQGQEIGAACGMLAVHSSKSMA